MNLILQMEILQIIVNFINIFLIQNENIIPIPDIKFKDEFLFIKCFPFMCVDILFWWWCIAKELW